MRNKVNVLLFLLVSVLAGILIPGSNIRSVSAQGGAAVYQWKFHSYLPVAEPDHSVANARFCEMVEKNTKGRVKMTLFPAGAIVQSPDLMNATRDGIIEMSSWDCAYGAGSVPVLGVVSGMPMSWRNQRELVEVLYDFGLSELSREAYAKYGVHLLGHNASSACGLGMISKKPIRNLNDLKGLKARVGPAFIEFWRGLGCSTVSLPLTELYMAISTGTIDAAAFDWIATSVFKVSEVAKYAVLPSQIGCTTAHIVVSPKAWDSLPDDLKTIISLTHRDWAAWMERYFHPYVRGSHEKAMNDLKAKGVKLITLSEADQAKMFQVAFKMWDAAAAKDPLSAKAVDIVKGYYRKVGRIK